MLVKMNVASAAGDYFFHFFDGAVGSNTFRARLFAKDDATSGTATPSPSRSDPARRPLCGRDTTTSYGTTYLVVVKYEVVAGTTNDIVSLFIDPTISMTSRCRLLTTIDATQADASNLDAIGLRQGGTSSGAQPTLTGSASVPIGATSSSAWRRSDRCLLRHGDGRVLDHDPGQLRIHLARRGRRLRSDHLPESRSARRLLRRGDGCLHADDGRQLRGAGHSGTAR